MYIISSALLLAEKVKKAKDDLKEVFQNKETYSHSTRWEAFEVWHTLGGECRGFNYEGWDNIVGEECFVYEGFYHTERYMKVPLVDLVDSYLDYDLTKAQVVEMKEALMRDAISSFVYDW